MLVGCVQSLVRYKPLAHLIAILKEKDLIVSLDSLDDLNPLVAD